MLCCDVLCCVMMCSVALCRAMLCYVSKRRIMSSYALCYPVMAHYVMYPIRSHQPGDRTEAPMSTLNLLDSCVYVAPYEYQTPQEGDQCNSQAHGF